MGHPGCSEAGHDAPAWGQSPPVTWPLAESTFPAFPQQELNFNLVSRSTSLALEENCFGAFSHGSFFPHREVFSLRRSSGSRWHGFGRRTHMCLCISVQKCTLGIPPTAAWQQTGGSPQSAHAGMPSALSTFSAVRVRRSRAHTHTRAYPRVSVQNASVASA